MQFYSSDPRTARIRWYFVPQGTPFVPYPNVFTSRIWDEDHIGWDGLGEVYGAVRTYDKGGSPPIVAGPGQLPCGTPDQWANGQPSPPAVPVQVDAFGNLACCDPAAPITFRPVAWYKADGVPVQANGSQVRLWVDSSGNGNDLGIGNGTTPPRYNVNNVGNLPSIRWYVGYSPLTNLSRALVLPVDFTVYIVAGVQLGITGQTFALKSAASQGLGFLAIQGQALVYDDPACVYQAPIPVPGSTQILLSIRRASGDLRVQNVGRTTGENIVTSTFGPEFSSLACAPSNPPYTSASTDVNEVVILPYAVGAAEDAYWKQYLASKWQIVLLP